MNTNTIHLKGIQSDVSIKRDKFYVPYISAENEEDVWFGLGYAQGLDRAFQLEFLKRQASGGLSEIFGERFLEADRFMRVIGLKRTAREYISVQSEFTIRSLNAFTAGINAGLFSEKREYDESFKLLGIAPTPYEVTDVICTHLFLSLALTHWLGKLTRFLLLEKESPETVDALDPEYAPWNYVTKEVGTKAGTEDGALLKELFHAKSVLNFKGASNNWVISGSKTKSGKPIVANDPHLAADIPAPLYLANIKGRDFQMCGACYPGSPVFFNGHNGNVAWGMTAAFIDNVDLFQEKLNSEKNSTLVDGEYKHCDQVVESIAIKDKEPHIEKVLISKHGPIISPAMRCGEHVISVCATWLKPKPIEGFFSIHKAKNISEVQSLFKGWPLTSTNLVMADTQGNIGWQLCGEIPNRKKTKGMLPMPGWDSTYDWNEEIIPHEDNPAIINPPEGFIVTANNKHKKIDTYPYTGRDFIDGYRHKRIINLLKSKEVWTLEDTIDMQKDWFSGPWAEMRDKVLAVKTDDNKVNKALDILKVWDGYMTPGSAATILYEYFVAGITKKIVTAIAPNSQEIIYETFNPAIGSACFAMSRISQIVKMINEQPADVLGVSWNNAICDELEKAVLILEAELGEDETKWLWGKYRPLILKHPIIRNLKEFNSEKYMTLLNLGPIPWGGDEQTLSVAAGSMLDPKVTPDFIPNYRGVIQVGDWEKCYFSLAGGASSDPKSKHYRDMFELWKDGKGINIAWSEEKVKEISQEEIILKRNSN